MSGFSAEWLELREPADHRARNRDLLTALPARFADREAVSVVDLGCGTGSNLRAIAPVLPPRQHWRLVDHDLALLAAARERLAAWGDRAELSDAGLTVMKGDRVLTIAFVQADLAMGLDGALGPAPEIVTAAALFDLVSPRWIERFAAAVAARKAAFYTALTYTGEETWDPPHPADPAMLLAFHEHQARDKGFGASAGPKATDALLAAFQAAGYLVRAAESPWQLASKETALIRELAVGVAQAVRETHRLPEAMIADWLEARLAGASCTIGHADMLALPS